MYILITLVRNVWASITIEWKIESASWRLVTRLVVVGGRQNDEKKWVK